MFKGGMGNIMKQAQQMQERMQKTQEELANLEVVGESGAGMVKVTMTCNHNVRRVEIDESLMEDDKDMVEDLVAAAFNDAARRVDVVPVQLPRVEVRERPGRLRVQRSYCRLQNNSYDGIIVTGPRFVLFSIGALEILYRAAY